MMNFDVFISYSSKDKVVADAACAALEAGGIRCWIAPRDIAPGMVYGDALIEALDNCRVMVLIFSSSANTSPQIRREVERVVSRGIPLVPLRIENVVPTKAMAFFVNAVHWLDALTPPLEAHLQRLTQSVRALLQVDSEPHSLLDGSSNPEGKPATDQRLIARKPEVGATDQTRRPRRGRRWSVIVAGIAVCAVVSLAVGFFIYGSRQVPTPSLSDVDRQDISGTYVGTYTGTHAPGQNQIVIDILVDGSNFHSTYQTSTGVQGVSTGTISGNVGISTSQNTSPNCPGTFKSSYIFYRQSITWTFSGNDCAGHEEGQGQATRKPK